jgi:hypothetical protein
LQHVGRGDLCLRHFGNDCLLDPFGHPISFELLGRSLSNFPTEKDPKIVIHILLPPEVSLTSILPQILKELKPRGPILRPTVVYIHYLRFL